MALVGYSDSESSDEGESKPSALKLSAPKHSKPTILKSMDRSSTGKIKVSLPDVRPNAQVVEKHLDEPQAKRPRLGGEGGGIANFNSFLPAPKRTALQNKDGVQRRLGKGVNLKTGATRGFDRSLPDSIAPNRNISEVTYQEDNDSMESFHELDLAEANSESTLDNGLTIDSVVKKPATMFKPLSVTRKPPKKKTATLASSPASAKIESKVESQPTTKVSFFSTGDNVERENAFPRPGIDAQPYSYEMIQEPEPREKLSFLPSFQVPPPNAPSSSGNFQEDERGAQSLDSIAVDLNLSASARRQLLGRGKQKGAATNVVNFNIDEEYAANEALRQAGEVQSHNPVRAIASGKHSLKQLVDAATNQKDALEEQFASGRRNKKEAGTKYGW